MGDVWLHHQALYSRMHDAAAARLRLMYPMCQCVAVCLTPYTVGCVVAL